MKHYVAVSFTAATLAASAVALATVANAAPTGPSMLDQTVRTLEASGYHVIVNRMGAAPLCAMHGQRRPSWPDAFHRGLAR